MMQQGVPQGLGVTICSAITSWRLQ